jgi:hypothetical protein
MFNKIFDNILEFIVAFSIFIIGVATLAMVVLEWYREVG